MAEITAAHQERIHWSGAASQAELDSWQTIAEGVARELAVDVLERDRANEDPHRELQLLRDSGLVNLLDPVEFGGGGAHWETAFLVIRTLARVDASVAQVLAYHFINKSNISFLLPRAEQAEWYRATIDGKWFWGDSVNPVDPNLELTVNADGWRLNGVKHFSTGASVGDRILISAAVTGGTRDGQLVLFVVNADAAGVEPLGDWDALGQRLSASGSVRYTDVRVTESDLLGELTDQPFANLITPGIQLAFANLYLGIAQGALEQARDLTRARRNAWFLSSADLYRNDPFVLRVFGEFVARVDAVEALADRAARRFDSVVALGDKLTFESRGAIEVEIAKVKIVSSEVGVEVTNRVFEATGSSSAKSSVGLDLFWRNIRTHSLHDPVDYKKLEVGAHFLNGEFQPISLYT
ncbi:acyl-CoA dehydrogenase family protein [Mycetocola zhadangensis]|uniref:Dibenzothiophene monooxygenase n=1 Tax=Mycetocola zhadangensis TaxID=1164595 RepID=A0A3L7ISG0_9MICO|nr:acyl-CoA dehydrogenase family protein [Mycetocola zhadangensis]RLQ81164.1 acyl-CoA dehydrogenase [Mycetocola zhadangensis]GGF05296.1 monooxygenase [Mycetocola zhadangensis]